ncbi:hypothetical protein IIB34_02865, partial [PVC group bacterium]|nr:hypothetical protein [PVC group bacterium]
TKMMTKTKKFAEAAGLDFEMFRKSVEDNPMEALKMLMKRIGSLNKMDAAAVLSEMGFEGVRIVGVMAKLSSGMEKLEKNIGVANEEWKVATSLQKEYEIFIQGTWSQLKILGQEIASAGLKMGDKLLPVIKELINKLKADLIPFMDDLSQKFVDNKDAIRDMILNGYEQFKTITIELVGAFKKLKAPLSFIFEAIINTLDAFIANTIIFSGTGLIGYDYFGNLGSSAVIAAMSAAAFDSKELAIALYGTGEPVEDLKKKIVYQD